MKRLRRKIYDISKKTGDKFGFDLPYFVENGFWSILNQAVSLLASLVLSVFLARYLSKGTFGEYQLILSIIGILSIFSLTGLNVSIAKSIAEGYDYSYVKAYKTGLRFSFLSIPIFLGIAYWYYIQNENSTAYALLISVLFFPFIYGFNKWVALLKGKAMFGVIAKIQILQNISSALFIIFVVVFFPDNILLVVFVMFFFQMSFNLYAHFSSMKFIKSKKNDKDCIPYGIYMTKISFLNIIVNNFDKILIGFFDIKLLAVYAVSLKILSVIKGFIKSFYQISFPKFAKKNIKISNKIIFLLLLSGMFFSIILYFVSEPLINLLYTDKYLASAILFKKFLLVIPFTFVNALLSNKMTAQKHKKRIFYTKIIIPLTAIILSVVMYVFSRNAELFILTKIYILNILFFIVLTPWFIKD
ncbi:MAG: oligosaccharide flippase family protein [Bacteroidales bacterium]|nr:oligosaccharide flippase family protein [Bacteroidales bacterium]